MTDPSTAPVLSANPELERKKDGHRRQLIEATIEAIYCYGIQGATVTRICTSAQLSRGMINLHFSSKRQLLREASRQVADQYDAHWQAALAAAGPEPVDRLRALLAADYDERVLNRRDLAVYFDFRAIARSNPEYMAAIDSRDARLRRAVLACCTELRDAGPYPDIDAHKATYAILAMQEGMWTDFHLHPDQFDRAAALETALHLVAAFFPRHLGLPRA